LNWIAGAHEKAAGDNEVECMAYGSTCKMFSLFHQSPVM
jgi:hypothetical protein